MCVQQTRGPLVGTHSRGTCLPVSHHQLDCQVSNSPHAPARAHCTPMRAVVRIFVGHFICPFNAELGLVCVQTGGPYKLASQLDALLTQPCAPPLAAHPHVTMCRAAMAVRASLVAALLVFCLLAATPAAWGEPTVLQACTIVRECCVSA
jgi:hypothetical protein